MGRQWACDKPLVLLTRLAAALQALIFLFGSTAINPYIGGTIAEAALLGSGALKHNLVRSKDCLTDVDEGQVPVLRIGSRTCIL